MQYQNFLTHVKIVPKKIQNNYSSVLDEKSRSIVFDNNGCGGGERKGTGDGLSL